MITPAISVLSAVEGLNLVTPAFEPYVLWITLAIIVALFAVQSYGTARVASLFGPITLIWFAAIAATGVSHIVTYPAVLWSFNPLLSGTAPQSFDDLGDFDALVVFVAAGDGVFNAMTDVVPQDFLFGPAQCRPHR